MRQITMQSPTQIRSIHRQKGFNLIEALVAFLILSVGMLGIASLQLISLKAGQTAVLRTVAVVKAEEIMERIRNNPTVVASYDSGTVGTGVDNGCNDYSGSVTECTAAQMVADDVYQWLDSLDKSLPNTGASGTVGIVNPVAGVNPLSVVTVTINWQERDPESQSMINMSYSTTSQVCDITTC